MRGVASLSREAIDGCRSSIDPEQLEQAAGLIRDAGNVYIFGVGDSLISSMAFANQLTHLGISCIVASQFGEDSANARGSSSDDVAILVSYSGVFFSEQARIMRMLRERGCRIVAITSRERLARDLDERREGDLVVDREVGEHTTVDLDTRGLEALDEAVVREAVRAGSGVDALDPEATELALLGATVTVGVDHRVDDLLLGLAVQARALPAVAARPLEGRPALLLGVDGPFYACHW